MSNEFDERLERLRRRFGERLRTDAARLRALLEAAPGNDRDQQIAALVHSLAGSASIFGFAEIGRAAKDMDAGMQSGPDAVAQAMERLHALLLAIEQAVDA